MISSPSAITIGSWVPKGCTNPDYVIAQYDAAVAYMDACIQQILEKLAALGLEEDTIVIFTSDHGETLYDHDCYFDHHGMYDCTLVVPLILRWKNHLPAGLRIPGYCQLKDVTPTLLDIMGIDVDLPFEGRSLKPLIEGKPREAEPEFYITECTWMRKHGWRTPEWKLIVSLEPDFHFKPEVELYNLVKDPEENHNVAEENPEVVEVLKKRMYAFIESAKRKPAAPRRFTPISLMNGRPFKSSQEAYDSKYIGGIADAVNCRPKTKNNDVWRHEHDVAFRRYRHGPYWKSARAHPQGADGERTGRRLRPGS